MMACRFVILGLAGAVLAVMPARANDIVSGPLSAATDLNQLPPVGGAVNGIDLSGVPVGTGSGTYTLPGGVTVDLGGITDPTRAGVVQGSSPGSYAAPIVDAQGDPYGGAYLSTGNGTISLDFTQAWRTFALLWGSVDTFNSLSFYNGNTLVGTLSGAQMPASNGSQGYGASFYTLVTSSQPFDQVRLSSGNYSFESADFEYGNFSVPEPASLALLGAGLAALGVVRRRRG